MPKKVNDHVRIWIDVEDFFVYFASARRPSGIQRLAFELHKSLRMLAGPDRVRFVRHNLPGITFGEVAWEEVEALFSGRVIHDAHPAAKRVRPPPAARYP